MSLPLAIRRRNLLAAYLLIETAAVFAGQTHLVVAYGLGAILVFNVLLYSVGEQTPWPVTAAATLGQLAYWFSLEFEVPSKNRTFLDDTLYLLPFFGFPAFADGQSAGGDDSMPTSRLASRRFSWSESSWQGRQWGGSGAESPPSSTSW